MKKAAVYCMTRNYYDACIPSIKSMLVNGKPDVVYLLIEDDEFPLKHKKLKPINVSGQQIFDRSGINYNSRWSYMAMMRAALWKVLREHRVLSLDCDTIVDGDISYLWNLPMDDYYLAGGREPAKSNGRLYVNMGVIMFNLKKLRDGKGEEIVHALNTRPYAFVDQDCINDHCQGGILEFPPEYNAHSWSIPTNNPIITHYAGFDKWNTFPLVQKYAAMEV